MSPRRPSFQRLVLGVILPLFLFANMVAVGVGIPRKVFAQGLPVIDALNISLTTTDNILDYLLQVLLDALTGAAVGGVLQLGKYFVGQFAASLKSGGAGQTPLFHNTTYGTFLIDTAATAAIDFLDSLGKNQLNDDVSDPAIRLAIQYGLRDVVLGTGNITKSEFGKVGDEFTDKWEKVQEKYGGCAVTANNASQSKSVQGILGQQGGIEDCMMALTKDVFKPANTELGVSLRAYNELYGTVMGAAQSALLERQEGKGYKGVQSQIAGYLKTPAALVGEEAKQLTSVVQEERMFQLLSGVLGSGSKTALGSVLGTYGSSLVSKLGKSTIDGLFEVKKPAKKDFAFGGGLQDASGGAGLQTSISAGFARALTETVAIRDAGLYDTLSQFASCPSESGRINRMPDECVIDGEFEAAVRRAEGGAPLTIGEAMKAGQLHANWKLVPPADEGLNTSPQCRTQAYCHANIAKLRLARILPLGFEIAATLSPGGQDSWTLGQVVEGFHDCNPNTGGRTNRGGGTVTHPFCHLIDPNWILKAPLTRCTAEVPGPMLAMSGVATRHSICVNKPSCLQDDGNGECVGPWGYCMREKNIWRFNGEMCSAQFATCSTYRGASAGAQEAVSYLARTIDFGRCTEQDVGCKKYAVNQRPPTTNWDTAGSALYLNARATTCNQPGCTEFKRADGSLVFLKKAPNYLRCYDSNHDLNAPGIDWPRTIADLAKITPLGAKPREECKQHAPVCTMDEVGCTRYTPESGDPPIPAITSASDRCPTECAGYNAYKQLPVTFEEARFPLYFIPSTAGQCAAEQVGCEQFVNLATEKLEYYSFVRQCEKPTEDNNAIFYAWEGSDLQGYQLRSYVLKKTAENIPGHVDDPFVNAKPAYAAMYNRELMEGYHGACNKELYTGKLADPDCRELFDRDGNTFYRLLSKTVTVAAECNALRKTDAYLYAAPRELIGNQGTCVAAKGQWDAAANVCRLCAGGGENRDGICIYSVIAKEATTCPAQAAGCRAYTGNAGNNVRVAYQALFDTETLDASAWSSGELSAESVKVGDKSLKVSGADTKLAIPLIAQSSYTMTFWAKGIGTLAVQFENTENEARVTDPFRLTGDWRQFAIGPVYMKSVGDSAKISFAVSNNNNIPLFLDNIVIKETVATVNLVKDSWQTPASCDANPRDNIPGGALGCQAYKDHNGASQTFKSFTRICRDAAVGCEELTDTHNTVTASGTTFMVRCGEHSQDTIARGTPERPGSRACTPVNLDVNGDGAIDVLDQKEVCTVPMGQDYCTFTLPYVLARNNAHFDGEDTIAIPEDRKAYLVNLPTYQCDTGQKGCMALGETTGTADAPQVASVSKLSDPEKFGDILCSADVVGCAAYQVTSQVGGDRTVYFRDPVITGVPTCEFRDKVKTDDIDASGWFRVGTDTPCYDNFLEAGARYGVWSYGDPPYRGHVATCPAEQNTCTEFRDPADTSQLYPEGQPYYVLDDGKLDRATCKGQVSLKEGCILLNNSSDPAKPWDVTETYKQSSQQRDGLVAPVAPRPSVPDTALDCPGNTCGEIEFQALITLGAPARELKIVANVPSGHYFPYTADGLLNGNWAVPCRAGYERRTTNVHVSGLNAGDDYPSVNVAVCVSALRANTVLKVVRDRACGEWLACQGAQTVLDKTTNQPKTACSEVALCNEFSQGTDRFEECTNWVTKPENDNLQLNENVYARRKVGWYDKEYSGFSLFDQYQIFDYKFVKRKDNGAVMLVAVPWKYDDAKTACNAVVEEGGSCSIGNTSGKCYGGLCTQGIGPLGRLAPQCRGYATPEAPFAFTDDQIKWEGIEKSRNGNDIKTTSRVQSFNVSGFERSNICQQGNTCQCNYQKITYGDGTFVRYFDEKWNPDKSLPRGACQGGFTSEEKSKTGRICTSSKQCRDERVLQDPDRDRRDGECILRTQVSKHRGWLGYCLETDGSIRTPGSGVNGRPCLTWMPLDNPPGLESLNQVEEAGYIPTPSSLYCVASEGNTAIVDGNKYTYEVEDQVRSFVNNAARKEFRFDLAQEVHNTRLYQLDYIKLTFSGNDADIPHGGAEIHIANDGIATRTDLLGTLPNKPRIYARSTAKCKQLAYLAGITSSKEPADAAENQRYVCKTSAENGVDANNMLDTYAGVVTLVRTHGRKTYFGVFFDDGEKDSDGGRLDSCGEVGGRSTGLEQEISCYVHSNIIMHANKWRAIGDDHDMDDDGDSGDGGWIAFSFDDNGDLESSVYVYTINLDADDDSAATTVGFNTAVVRREMCKEVVDIGDNAGNAAWTNRLWNPSNLSQKSEPGYAVSLGAANVGWGDTITPYGAIKEPLNTAAPVYQQSQYHTTDSGKFAPIVLADSGVMYSCPEGKCVRGLANFGKWGNDTLAKGKEALAKLFGKTYSFWGWNANDTQYDNESCPASPGNDHVACYDKRRDSPRPPRVASLDMANCKITGVGEANNCGLGRLDRIIIDGRDDGIIFGKGYRNVVLRFFGWADTDRMPIRNITVDWDYDNRITGGNPGKFKNKKTRCSASAGASSCSGDVNVTCSNDAECGRNNLGTCLTKQCEYRAIACTTDADCVGQGGGSCRVTLSFGNAPDACEKGFHEFFGSYNFQPDNADCNFKVGQNNPAGVTTAELTRNGLSFGDRYCAFKPKVIIIDNWGWCNGTCAEGNGKGCWGSDDPEAHNKCTDSSHADYSKAGTSFNGWIIVAEQK